MVCSNRTKDNEGRSKDGDDVDLIESVKVFCRLTVKVKPPNTGKQLLES